MYRIRKTIDVLQVKQLEGLHGVDVPDLFGGIDLYFFSYRMS